MTSDGCRIGAEGEVSGTTALFLACPLIRNAPNLSDKSVIHSFFNNSQHLLLVQPFDLESLNSPLKMFIRINTCPNLVFPLPFTLPRD